MTSLEQFRDTLENRSDRVVVPAGFVDGAVRRGIGMRQRRWAAAGAGSLLVAAAIVMPIVITAGPPSAPPPAGPSATSTPPAARADGPPAIPYAMGNVLVDGDRRIELDGEISGFVRVEGVFAVVVMPADAQPRLEAVLPDGSTRVLDDGPALDVVAGPGGSGVALAWRDGNNESSSSLYAITSLDAEPVSFDVDESLPIDLQGVTADGRVVYTHNTEPVGPIQAWDVAAGTSGLLVDGLDDPPLQLVALRRDGALAVTLAESTGCLSAYDVVSGAVEWERCGWSYQASVSPDGSIAFDGSTFVDARTGDVLATADEPPAEMMRSVWEDEGHVLLIGVREVFGTELLLVRCAAADGRCVAVPGEGHEDGVLNGMPVLESGS